MLNQIVWFWLLCCSCQQWQH